VLEKWLRRSNEEKKQAANTPEIVLKDAVDLLKNGGWHKIVSKRHKITQGDETFIRCWINGKVENPSDDSFDKPTENQCYLIDYYQNEKESFGTQGRGKIKINGKEVSVGFIDLGKEEFFVHSQEIVIGR
jgi:hypothetical protein